jgi:GAF domain-containing protein
MPPAPKPSNENARLQAVRAHFAGGEAHDDGLQEVAEAAAEILGAPIALVSIVDAEHQFFPGNHGLTGCQTTLRDVAFCGYTILGDDLLEVPDATTDSRFRDNPLVVGPPYIRFYAGVPLVTDDDARIGTLCVIDTEPRYLGAADCGTRVHGSGV